MNNGIAIGLALICLMLLIVLFKWALNQFQFFLALIAGLNQDSDNQWKAIHQLQQRPGQLGSPQGVHTQQNASDQANKSRQPDVGVRQG